jgi:hypothetical protein
MTNGSRVTFWLGLASMAAFASTTAAQSNTTGAAAAKSDDYDLIFGAGSPAKPASAATAAEPKNLSADPEHDLAAIFRLSEGCYWIDQEGFQALRTLVEATTAEVAALLDADVRARIEATEEKPFQRSVLLKEVGNNPAWQKRVKGLRASASRAEFCREPGSDLRVEFDAGVFRLAMGDGLLLDRLVAAAIAGNFENDGVLSVGAWSRIECWQGESQQKQCGPAFRDLPKGLKASMEDGKVKWRWRWRGLPEQTKGSFLTPWNGSFKRSSTQVLSIKKPAVEFLDEAGAVIWTAR